VPVLHVPYSLGRDCLICTVTVLDLDVNVLYVPCSLVRGIVRAGLAVSKLMDLVVPTFKQVQLASRDCLIYAVTALYVSVTALYMP